MAEARGILDTAALPISDWLIGWLINGTGHTTDGCWYGRWNWRKWELKNAIFCDIWHSANNDQVYRALNVDLSQLDGFWLSLTL